MGMFSTTAEGVTCTGHAKLAAIRSRLPAPSTLPFGRTPWDGLSREDLVFLVTSMYAAMSDVARLVPEVPSPASDVVTLAGVRAALGHVYPDYLGEPVAIPVAYGRDAPCGRTDADALDERLGTFRDLLAFSSPSRDWWVCLRCHAGRGCAPGAAPGDLGPACGDAGSCDWRRASWDVVRRIAGVGGEPGDR